MEQDFSFVRYSISPSAAPSVDNNSIGKTSSNDGGNLRFNGPQGHTETAGSILRLVSVVGLWTFILLCALYFKWEENRSSRRRRPLTLQGDAATPSALTDEELSQGITKLLACTSKIVEAKDLVPDNDANISGSCKLTEKETSESDLSSVVLPLQSTRSIDIEQGDDADTSQSSSPPVVTLSNFEICVENVSHAEGTIQLRLPLSPLQDPYAQQLHKVKPRFVVAQCAICLLPYKQNDEVTWSPNSDECLHAFHTNCIASWLARQQRQANENPKCPCCRNDFLKLPQDQ